MNSKPRRQSEEYDAGVIGVKSSREVKAET